MGEVAPCQLAEPVRRVVGVRPGREHQEGGGPVGEVEQPFDQLNRSGIRPVDVFDHHDERDVPGKRREQLADNLEGPVLQRFRRHLEPSRKGGLEGHTEHAGQIRIEPLGCGDSVLETSMQRYPSLQLGVVDAQIEPTT